MSFYFIFDRIEQLEGEINIKFCKLFLRHFYFYLDFQKNKVGSSREPENKKILAYR